MSIEKYFDSVNFDSVMVSRELFEKSTNRVCKGFTLGRLAIHIEFTGIGTKSVDRAAVAAVLWASEESSCL